MYLGDDGGVDGTTCGDVSVDRSGDEAVRVSVNRDNSGRDGGNGGDVDVDCGDDEDGDRNVDGGSGGDDDGGDVCEDIVDVVGDGGDDGGTDLYFLRNKIKDSEGAEKVHGCLLLLHGWNACKNKKAYSSLKTFLAKSVRPVCNCLKNHHNGNVELFITHHNLSSIHNFYLKCKGNGTTCSNV